MSQLHIPSLARLTAGLSLEPGFFLVRRGSAWPGASDEDSGALNTHLELAVARLAGLTHEKTYLVGKLSASQQADHHTWPHGLDGLIDSLRSAQDERVVGHCVRTVCGAIETRQASIEESIVTLTGLYNVRARATYLDQALLAAVAPLTVRAGTEGRFEVDLANIRQKAERALQEGPVARLTETDCNRRALSLHVAVQCGTMLQAAPTCAQLALRVEVPLAPHSTAKETFETCIALYQGLACEHLGRRKEDARNGLARSRDAALDRVRDSQRTYERGWDPLGRSSSSLFGRDSRVQLALETDLAGRIAMTDGALMDVLHANALDAHAPRRAMVDDAPGSDDEDGDQPPIDPHEMQELLQDRRDWLVVIIDQYLARFERSSHPAVRQACFAVQETKRDTINYPARITDEHGQRVVPLTERKRQVRQLDVLLGTLERIRVEVTGEPASTWNVRPRR